MQTRLLRLIKDFSFVILSNLLTLLTSSLTVLILPRLIGSVDYGYWQLYVFYISYVGLFHLGWVDGIYLKFGGERYDRLDKAYFYSDLINYSLFNLVLALLVGGASYMLVSEGERQFIFLMLALNIMIMNARYMYIYILQATNRLRDSSMILMSDRFFYIVLVTLVLLLGSRDYKIMIFADLAAKTVSLVYGMFVCRDLIFNPLKTYRRQLGESFDNIKIGINLMLSNVASMLIIGIVRMGIERRWDIATFGKVSLTLSISNLVMTFINAIGLVIFPRLKRAKPESLPILYTSLRALLMPLLFFLLLFYFPLKLGLRLWLPAYQESLLFMALIFPISVYEGKMALLINTYLKALRMEKVLLRVNVTVTLLSGMFTLISVFIMGNLELAVSSIVLLLAIRSSLAEYRVSRVLNLKLSQHMVIETGMTCLFIAAGWFLPWHSAVFVYGLAYVVYIIGHLKDVKLSLDHLKTLE